MSRGYYVQFLISVENKVETQPTGKTIGLDVGVKEFYTDSNGHNDPNPIFYITREKRIKFYQRRVSRKKKGSINRKKAINKLGRGAKHLRLKIMQLTESYLRKCFARTATRRTRQESGALRNPV